MKAFDYAIARNLAGAADAFSNGYKARGGGIDLIDLQKERIEKSDKFVTVKGIPELGGIALKDGVLTIGAAVTLRELSEHKDVVAKFPGLAHAAGEAATPQIRALATAAGNLCQRPRCWYFRDKNSHCLKKGGDTCFSVNGDNSYHAVFGDAACHIVAPSNLAPILTACGAELLTVRAGKEGTRKLAEFYTGPLDKKDSETVLEPDELITSIRVSKLPEKSAYVEMREKLTFDWPLATASVALVDGEWNVVLGCVSPKPWRAAKAEEVLGSASSITPELAERAGEAALDGAQPMSNNRWRLPLVKAAVRRALLIADGKEF